MDVVSGGAVIVDVFPSDNDTADAPAGGEINGEPARRSGVGGTAADDADGAANPLGAKVAIGGAAGRSVTELGGGDFALGDIGRNEGGGVVRREGGGMVGELGAINGLG